MGVTVIRPVGGYKTDLNTTKLTIHDAETHTGRRQPGVLLGSVHLLLMLLQTALCLSATSLILLVSSAEYSCRRWAHNSLNPATAAWPRPRSCKRAWRQDKKKKKKSQMTSLYNKLCTCLLWRWQHGLVCYVIWYISYLYNQIMFCSRF